MIPRRKFRFDEPPYAPDTHREAVLLPPLARALKFAAETVPVASRGAMIEMILTEAIRSDPLFVEHLKPKPYKEMEIDIVQRAHEIGETLLERGRAGMEWPVEEAMIGGRGRYANSAGPPPKTFPGGEVVHIVGDEHRIRPILRDIWRGLHKLTDTTKHGYPLIFDAILRHWIVAGEPSIPMLEPARAFILNDLENGKSFTRYDATRLPVPFALWGEIKRDLNLRPSITAEALSEAMEAVALGFAEEDYVFYLRAEDFDPIATGDKNTKQSFMLSPEAAEQIEFAGAAFGLHRMAIRTVVAWAALYRAFNVDRRPTDDAAMRYQLNRLRAAKRRAASIHNVNRK